MDHGDDIERELRRIEANVAKQRRHVARIADTYGRDEVRRRVRVRVDLYRKRKAHG